MRNGMKHQDSSGSEGSETTLLTHPKAECLRKLITRNQQCQSMVFNLESAKAEIVERSKGIRDLERAAQAGQLAQHDNSGAKSPQQDLSTQQVAANWFNVGHEITKVHKEKKKFGVHFGVFGKKEKKIKNIGRQDPVEDGPEASSSKSGEAYIEELKQSKEDVILKAEEIRKELVNHIGSALEAASEAERHLVKNDLHKWKVQQRMAQVGPKEKHEQQQSELDRLDPIFEQCGDEIRKLKNLVEQTAEEVKREESSSSSSLRKLQEYLQQISKLIYRFVWEKLALLVRAREEISDGRAKATVRFALRCHSPAIRNFLPGSYEQSELSRPEALALRNLWKIALSCIIARQPPSVIVKSGPPGTNSTTTGKLQVQPAIRLLGGASLGCRANNRAEVTCQLISEEQAKCVGKPGQKIIPVGKLLHNLARFELDTSSHRFFAYFNRPMILTDLHRQARTESEFKQRFYFLFTIKMTGGSMVLQAPKISLPVLVLNGPDLELEDKADAYIFWEHAFAEDKGVLTPVPREGSDGVLWPLASKALSLKFMQLIEGRDPESQDFATQQLSPIALKHLASKFFGPMADYSQCRLKWEQFYDEEISTRSDGKRCVFWEWFYAASEIVNKKLFKHWNKGLIQGFLGKNAAEELLMSQAEQRATMIIKFSDGTVACLIITYYDPQKHPHPYHLQLIGQDLEKVPFEEIVQDTQELDDVQWIYPDKLKVALWKPDNAAENYGKRIHNPYAKRVCGSKGSVHMSQWEDPTPPPGLREMMSSSEDDGFDAASQSISLSFGDNNESLSFD